MAVDQKGPDTWEGQKQLREKLEKAFGPRTFFTALFPPEMYFEHERDKFLDVAEIIASELRDLGEDVPEFKWTSSHGYPKESTNLLREGLSTILEFLDKDHDEKTNRVIKKAMKGHVSSVDILAQELTPEDARMIRSIAHLSYVHNEASEKQEDRDRGTYHYDTYWSRLRDPGISDHLDAGMMLLAGSMVARRRKAPVEPQDNRFE